MKTTLLITILALFSVQYGFSCSVFKITENGTTVVGNNEDYFNPSTKIWFVPGSKDQYGVANVGFDNGFQQGAMNSAGLVFDGFAMPFLAVNDTAGKIKIPNTEYLPHIMHNFSTVREVKDYFETINLSHLSTSMYLFVDKTGDYLIVEGDSLILGNDAVFTLSNFYPSQTADQDDVVIPFFQKGKNYIKNNALSADFQTCSNVMQRLQQGFTQYSSMYNLNDGSIKIHHFHNYEEAIEFNLEEELTKEEHALIIPEQFSTESDGYKYYYDYNFDAEAICKRIGDEWNMVREKVDANTLQKIAVEAERMLNTIGYEWLRRDQIEGAITIFTFNTELFENSSNVYDSLGEAYLEAKNYDRSIENYKIAVRLDKKNKASKEMLKKAKRLKKEN